MRPEDEVDAQTLMVLGRLASGVAHDFNNQLTSIIGYTDLLLAELKEQDPARLDLVEIRRAAERAHLVTRHLVTFGRPHPPQLVVLNLADTLMSSVRLLKRILGDDIQLVTAIERESMDRDPALVRADPGQIGQMLLSLLVHARQNLPHGGTLTISLGNSVAKASGMFPPVRLRVQATERAGVRREQAEAGSEGSPPLPLPNLGLPLVEQIARQHGGDLHTESDGTLAVQLPRVDADRTGAIVQSAPPSGHEDVLIVEDDGGVRDLVGTILERQGYQVMRTERPSQALAVAASPRHIDLAIVDIILPEQRGDALAEELTRLRPGLRVLYMSGHTEHEIGPRVGAAQRFFLRKPFTPGELLICVRQALDSFAAA